MKDIYTYYTPTVLCNSGSGLQFLFLKIILFFQTIGFIATSLFTWSRGELHLSWLLFSMYWEETFIWYILSRILNENRPICSIINNPIFESYRKYGMPSYEIEILFTYAAFIVGYIILTLRLQKLMSLLLIIILPILAIFSVVYTRNNTLSQALIGALIGSFNGIRRILVYQFFLKPLLFDIFKIDMIKKYVSNLKIDILDKKSSYQYNYE